MPAKHAKHTCACGCGQHPRDWYAKYVAGHHAKVVRASGSFPQRVAPVCGCVTTTKVVRGMCVPHYKRWQYEQRVAGIRVKPLPPSFVVADQRQGEEWRPVAGLKLALEASNRGRVRRPATSELPARLLRPTPDLDGYLTVRVDGKTRRVHRLVMLAFVGPRPPGLQIRHLDGNNQHNDLSNLKYGTPAENAADKIRHGTSKHKPGRKYRQPGTHCGRGHDMSVEAGRRSNGARYCKACHRENASRRYWANKEAS